MEDVGGIDVRRKQPDSRCGSPGLSSQTPDGDLQDLERLWQRQIVLDHILWLNCSLSSVAFPSSSFLYVSLYTHDSLTGHLAYN